MTYNDMGGNKVTLRDVIKFLGAGGIFFCMLRKNENVGQQDHTDFIQDYLYQNTTEPGIMQTGFITPLSEEKTHNAADIFSFQTRCERNIFLCPKINFIGERFPENKGETANTIGTVSDFIDSNNAISSQFTKTINSITVNNQEENKRGYATRNTIVFNKGDEMDNKEFFQVSTHELGHIFDLGFLQGSKTEKSENYTEFGKPVFAIDDPSLLYYNISRINENTRRASAKKKDFCSGYGMSDPFEDFAECYNLFLNHNALFKVLGQKNILLGKKYNFIASMMKGKYINNAKQNLIAIKNNPNYRVRDTTKIDLP